LDHDNKPVYCDYGKSVIVTRSLCWSANNNAFIYSVIDDNRNEFPLTRVYC